MSELLTPRTHVFMTTTMLSMEKGKEMNDSEDTAKRIVESLLPGARMDFNGAQSCGEHDFNLLLSDGTLAGLEVTRSTDQNRERTCAEIRNQRRGGQVLPRVHASGDWRVHPMCNANLSRIRRHIDLALAKLESEGRLHFNAFSDCAESRAVVALLRLGVERGSVIPCKSPSIVIAVPTSGGMVDAELVNQAIEVLANKPDNRRKLDNAKGHQKHLFVVVTQMRHATWVALRDGPPPANGPTLPLEITHVWVAAWAGHRTWHRVWFAERNQRWRDMGVVNTKTGEIICTPCDGCRASGF